jgi:DNA polymerase V
MWRDGYNYKKAGVIVMNSIPENQIQYNFFDEVDREKACRSMQALDSINEMFGCNLLSIGIMK